MARHVLSDLDVRKAKARDKPYRLFDGEGLALLVLPSEVKSWQFRYTIEGKGKTVTLGKFDRLSLAEARVKAEQQRRLLDKGEDPAIAKRLGKLQRRAENENTFDALGRDWVKRESRRQKWTAGYVTEVERSIRNHLSTLDGIPVDAIRAPTLAPILRRVESTAPMMVEKVRRRLNAILDYAVEHGVIVGNPLPSVRRGRKVERRHYPAVTSLSEIGNLLRAAQATDPCKGVARAHLLLVFTALRVSEVVGAKWSEFELEGIDVTVDDGHRTKRDANAGNWMVPRERMKRKDKARGPHIVPLPPALLSSLRAWRQADGDDAQYVCPAPRDASKSITPESIEKHYRNALGLGGKHSPHSWRSAFSTICREAGKDGDTVEAQLDHIVGSKVSSAYDRATRLALRRELMVWYEGKLIDARDYKGVRRGAPAPLDYA